MNTHPPLVRLTTRLLQLLLVSGSCFVTVIPHLHAQTCNDLSLVSLDAACSAVVTPDMILEGAYADSVYVVALSTLLGVPLGTTTLGSAHLGDTLRAKVTDSQSGNSCQGLLLVEDKLPPAIACTHLNLPCALPQYAPVYLAGLGLAAAFPAVTENCGAYTLSYSDTWVNLGCDDPAGRSAYIERVWTAADGSGNQSTCTQYLNIRRIGASQLQWPADTVVSCSNPLTGPNHTGRPFLTEFGTVFPLTDAQQACGLQVAYTDQILPLCGGAYTIIRTWTLSDDCLPVSPVPPLTNPLIHIQVIQATDTEGPSFACPKDTAISTDPFLPCSRTFDLPDVILTDHCAAVASIRADWAVNGIPDKLAGQLTDFPGNNWWMPDTLGVLGFAQHLPAGVTTFRYTATDTCGNQRSCTFRVTVSDGIPPFVACDEFTQVALGLNGTALVNAATFDDGSVDNCSSVRFKARRQEPNDCQPNDRFYDQVKFCCADAGDTLAVVLRVYDIPVDSGAVGLTEAENHASDCLVYVLVEDKLKPACTPPPNLTITCDHFDPSLAAHGAAAWADNCCLDTVWEAAPNYALFDTFCNRGTLVRTFRASDCAGQSSQCTQRILVGYLQDYYLKMPDDIVVYDCDTTGVYGPPPEVFGKFCEHIAISYTDNVSTGGVQSCYRIERKWQIVNWCTYNPNVPLIEVPNPNPVATPQDPKNLPGPVIAPSGNNPPATVMRISPNDPAPTDFSIFWAPDATGYQYRQIISVLDEVPPKIRGCPEQTEPVEFCDQTDNDPLFWNQPYWSTPFIPGSTDLCEGFTDLAVTASDGCSKGNVNIRYLLFLDLDGDGKTETVINSVNPPPANTVLFGNAMTPDFAGGEPRAFDHRPVPQDEKYRFAIQLSGFVNRTAWVRWVSEKNPTQYVVPQLPHGRHHIMWIIEDGCGNESICQYPIRVRDCRNPDLVCINGLSVDLMQTKDITLWAADFLIKTGDNCTPPGQIRLGIRKAGAGINFPFDLDGNPLTSVAYTCDELGAQPVELWSIDAAGNMNSCETYVVVQDNFGVCAGSPAVIAGAVKTETGNGVEAVDVRLDGAAPGLPPLHYIDQTDVNGQFQFSSFPSAADLTLAPAKDNDPLNGVSTFDLVLINKHILGIAPLSSPYKMIAADANNSRSITTFDIIELRKLILGTNSSFPNNTAWRFVDKAYQFPNPSNPFHDVFPETVTLTGAQGSINPSDFVAVKVGDVSGNAVTSSLAAVAERSGGVLVFDITPSDRRRYVAPGDTFTVGFTAAEKVDAFQFTLQHPGLEVIDIQPGETMNAGHFAVFPTEQALTTAFDADPALKTGPARFSITFRALAGGQLNKMLSVSSRITRAEAYNVVNVVNVVNGVNGVNGGNVVNEADRLDISFRFQEEGEIGKEDRAPELYQNTPNPWSEDTQIRFYLPEAGEAQLTVSDERGTVYFSRKGWHGKGVHSVALAKRHVPAPGVYFYRIATASGSLVRKMVVF